jgi:hypothetical protein
MPGLQPRARERAEIAVSLLSEASVLTIIGVPSRLPAERAFHGVAELRAPGVLLGVVLGHLGTCAFEAEPTSQRIALRAVAAQPHSTMIAGALRGSVRQERAGVLQRPVNGPVRRPPDRRGAPRARRRPLWRGAALSRLLGRLHSERERRASRGAAGSPRATMRLPASSRLSTARAFAGRESLRPAEDLQIRS